MDTPPKRRGRPPKPTPAPNPRSNELREVSARIRSMQTDLRDLETRRNELVRAAIEDGWTNQYISDLTGLTRGRIWQIAASDPS